MKNPDRVTLSYGNGLDFPGLTEACGEGCPGFKRLSLDGWSDYGLCKNPRSPRHGSPVRTGRACPYSLALSPSRPA